MPVSHRKSTSIDVQLGARVRMRRLELGLSQMALAAQLEMTFQQIQKYERGVNRIASGTLVELARALEVSTSWLLGENEAPFNERPDAFGADSLKLLNLFRKIADPGVRLRVIALVSALTEAAPAEKASVEEGGLGAETLEVKSQGAPLPFAFDNRAAAKEQAANLSNRPVQHPKTGDRDKPGKPTPAKKRAKKRPLKRK